MAEYRLINVALIDKGFSDLNPLTLGTHECPPHHVGYGSRPYHLIHYVTRGEGVIKIGGKSYSVGKGQVFIIPKGAEAQYVADGQRPWEYMWVGFVGSLSERLHELPAVMNASPAPYDFLRGIISGEGAREELVAAALFMIFADLFSAQKVRPDYVKQTVDAINSLYMTGITVASLSNAVGLDRRYLCRIFHERMGMGVKEYLIRVRMEKARALLLEGKSVALTAELVGYNDQFNFAKMFKSYYGQTPGSVYR